MWVKKRKFASKNLTHLIWVFYQRYNTLFFSCIIFYFIFSIFCRWDLKYAFSTLFAVNSRFPIVKFVKLDPAKIATFLQCWLQITTQSLWHFIVNYIKKPENTCTFYLNKNTAKNNATSKAHQKSSNNSVAYKNMTKMFKKCCLVQHDIFIFFNYTSAPLGTSQWKNVEKRRMFAYKRVEMPVITLNNF